MYRRQGERRERYKMEAKRQDRKKKSYEGDEARGKVRRKAKT